MLSLLHHVTKLGELHKNAHCKIRGITDIPDNKIGGTKEKSRE